MELHKITMMSLESICWKLCLVADIEAASGRDILPLLEEAVLDGVTVVQLRSKELDSRKFLELGIKASKLLLDKKVPLIINDRVDISLLCGAAGVHLGQKDLPLTSARKLLGRSKLIGISVNTPEEARRAEREGADYLGAGPVYATLSKADLRPLIGLDGLKQIRNAVSIPILAIGGIHKENVRDVIESGADGVAVISAILGKQDISRAARDLLLAMSAR